MNSVSTIREPSISLGVLGAFAGIYLIWGTTYLAIALTIQTIPPFISGAVRFLLAARAVSGRKSARSLAALVIIPLVRLHQPVLRQLVRDE